jgi:predicted CoA-binding protein
MHRRVRPLDASALQVPQFAEGAIQVGAKVLWMQLGVCDALPLHTIHAAV